MKIGPAYKLCKQISLNIDWQFFLKFALKIFFSGLTNSTKINEVFIVSHARTPLGAFQGYLASMASEAVALSSMDQNP